MEHTLQLLFCFLFIYSFSEALANRDKTVLPVKVYIYGLLMVTTRYETMSMMAIACLLLAFRNQWWKAISLGVFSLLPVIGFGLFAMSKGSFFMPNSVLLKSGMPPLTLEGLSNFFLNIFRYRLLFVLQDYNFLTAQRLLLILPLVYLLFLDAIQQRPAYGHTLIILMGAVLGHVCFAYYSPYPRYEAYLVGCSLVVMGTLAVQHGREVLVKRIKDAEWIAWSLLGILAIPLLFRCTNAFGNAGQSCMNIYDQQYQMAKFVHAYYNDAPIAFNDIGAVSYCSEGPKLDLVGIASLDILKSKRLHYWSPAFAESISHRRGVKVAILYERCFDPGLLHRWNKIASWQIRNNVIEVDDSVSFYSIDTTNMACCEKTWRPSSLHCPRV